VNRLLVVVLPVVVSCGAITAQTRRTFSLDVAVTVPAVALESGWTLSEVTGSGSFTSMRFFSGKVLIGARFDPLSLLISTAWAHPGHYIPGEALGEVLSPLVVDFGKRDVQPWGTANAVTGSYGSAQLTYAMTGLRLKGVATKNGKTVRFDTGLLTSSAPLEGLKFDREMDTAPGGVRLTVDLGVLLSRVEFDQSMAMPGADGVVVFDPTSPAFNGLTRGATDTGSYRLSWQSN